MEKWLLGFFRYTAIGLAVLLLGYTLLPILGLILGLRDVGSVNLLTAFESTRVRYLLFDSLRIAVFVGLLSSILGFAFASILKRMSHLLRNIVAGALLLLYLLSPYLLAQSFIASLGKKGIIWQAFGGEALFSIYTVPGVIAIATIWLTPLALIIHLSASALPLAYRDELKALNVSWLKWIRYYAFPAYGTAFLLSFGLCSLIAFWNYDLASMLRVNVFPIDVMAAFGSFYDYKMALELVVFPGMMSLVLLSLLGWCASKHLWGAAVRDNRANSRVQMGFTPVQGLVLAGVLIGYAIFLSSLWNTIGSYDIFETEMAKFRSEWWNTIKYGMFGTIIVTFVSFLMSMLGRLTNDRFSQWIASFTVLIWLFPAVLLGMGWISVWNIPVLEIGRRWGIEMYLIGIHSASTIVPILVVVMSLRWRCSNNQALDSVHVSMWMRMLLFLNSQRGFIGILLFISFATIVREVPAGLLNMPPNGGTLALSIETLLHFEQPVRVASICLAYFLTIFICCVIFCLLGYVFDQFNKALLQRHLKV